MDPVTGDEPEGIDDPAEVETDKAEEDSEGRLREGLAVEVWPVGVVSAVDELEEPVTGEEPEGTAEEDPGKLPLGLD